jgi:hypothetical protein
MGRVLHLLQEELEGDMRYEVSMGAMRVPSCYHPADSRLHLQALEAFLGQKPKKVLADLQELAPGKCERIELLARRMFKRSRDRKEVMAEHMRAQQAYVVQLVESRLSHKIARDERAVTQGGRFDWPIGLAAKLVRVIDPTYSFGEFLPSMSDDDLSVVANTMDDGLVDQMDVVIGNPTRRHGSLGNQLKRCRDFYLVAGDLSAEDEKAMRSAGLEPPRIVTRRRLVRIPGQERRVRKGRRERERMFHPLFLRPFAAYGGAELVLQIVPLWDVMIERMEEATRPMELDESRVLLEFPNGEKLIELNTQRELEQEGDALGHCVGNYWRDVESGETRIFSIRKINGRPKFTLEFTLTRIDDDRAVWLCRQCKGASNRVPGERPGADLYVPDEVAQCIAAVQFISEASARDAGVALELDMQGTDGAYFGGDIEEGAARQDPEALIAAAGTYEDLVPGTLAAAKAFADQKRAREARNNPRRPFTIMGSTYSRPRDA